jgi:hypothetical protein
MCRKPACKHYLFLSIPKLQLMKKVKLHLLLLLCLTSSLAVGQVTTTLIPSEKGKTIRNKELLKPLLFRWTPVAARANEVVTYRLKVWQLKQGQTTAQAMQTTPLLTKEVQNAAETTVPNLVTNPCKPPYICEFIWQVEALDKNARTILGGSSGNTQIFSFILLPDNINIKIDSVSTSCCKDSTQKVSIWVRNLNANTVKITAIKYRINNSTAAPTTLVTTPVLPSITLTPTSTLGSIQEFKASIPCIDSMRTIKYIVYAELPSDPDNTNNETATDTLHCCSACDSLKIPSPAVINYNADNTLSFNQAPITTTPLKPVKSIQAELVYFEMTPENDLCLPCDKDAATYGHFTNGTNSIKRDGAAQSLSIVITTPQLTPCCSAVFRWCIRYKIILEDCSSCTKVVCYEKRKVGCQPQPILNNNQK